MSYRTPSLMIIGKTADISIGAFHIRSIQYVRKEFTAKGTTFRRGIYVYLGSERVGPFFKDEPAEVIEAVRDKIALAQAKCQGLVRLDENFPPRRARRSLIALVRDSLTRTIIKSTI